MSRNAGSRWRWGLAAALALAMDAALPAARGEPALYVGAGGWTAVTGFPADGVPGEGLWNFVDGVWIGRESPGLTRMEWGHGAAKQVAEAQALPPRPVALPRQRNAFGDCAVRSLSIRFDSAVRSRRWSIIFPKTGVAPELEPLDLPGSPAAELTLELEDAASGQRWELQPTRRGREGGRFPSRSDPRFYAGTVDDGDVDWTLIVIPLENGRQILQGQILLLKSDARFFRLRLGVRAGAPGAPLLQAESPPAVLAVAAGRALALFPDLAEPRRFRAWTDRPEEAGIEYDLAVTKATGNFPRRAAFSLEVEAWETADPESARREATEKLARFGGGVPLPDGLARDGLGAVPMFEPAAMRLAHPGGFQNAADAMDYLLLRSSGLFPDFAWAASAYQCAAQDAAGEPQVALDPNGGTAVVNVNPDPDLDALLDFGQNRGLTTLNRIRRSGAPAVWIRAGASAALDHGTRALYLCDYPAVWDSAAPAAPAVDLRHAEAELISSLSCALKAAGTCLLVEDAGPLAPFTTVYADALVCASADPAEMRRPRALAGSRPVLWIPADAAAPAADLARELGFVRSGPIGQN